MSKCHSCGKGIEGEPQFVEHGLPFCKEKCRNRYFLPNRKALKLQLKHLKEYSTREIEPQEVPILLNKICNVLQSIFSVKE